MIETVYIEKKVESYKYTKEILYKVRPKNIIICKNYNEIFNKKNQNFRLQKKFPSIILAEKQKNLVLETPQNFSIGGKNNYYFSHMLNCIYDCKYCFLQGMYNSANYVVFVNWKNFTDEIERISNSFGNQKVYFFSGYDCDSLALEPITNFAKYFINFFKNYDNSILELRTKSTQTNFLDTIKPSNNIIIAFSMNPQTVIAKYESDTPSLSKRLNAILRLQNLGWKVGLRFDPLLYEENYKEIYTNLFKEISRKLQIKKIHSITIGSFRLPKPFYKKINKLYPREFPVKGNLIQDTTKNQYHEEKSNELIEFCHKELLKYFPEKLLFYNH